MNTITNNPTVKSPQQKRVKAASYIGSAVGIGAAVGGIYAMAKKGNPNLKFKNLKYGERDIILIGTGSIIGGLAGGLAADKNKENRVPKIREGIQQFFGSLLVPVGLVGVGEKLLEKSKFKMPQIKSAPKVVNRTLSALPKIGVTVAALITGMNVGNKIVNKINNKIFKQEVEYDVKPLDYLVHADDLCVGANIILKDSSLTGAVSKILPAAFILAGAKTGMEEKK